MPQNSPLFSIVMPTRNRAHLLPNALRSALNQDFDDYEIVVVANDCKDNTREVVQRLATSRVRYFETDKMLTMPENWEFSWTKARGKYVTFLCDDDALVPSALKLLAEKAIHDSPAIVTWEDAHYYYSDWHDEMLQNVSLLFFLGDKEIEDMPASVLRRQLAHFECPWNAPIPKMLNCIARRDFFEEWRQRLGQLFYPTSPDYAFAWITAHICDFIRIFHRPLCVRGVSDNSIGCNAGFGNAAQTYLKEFGDFDFFAETKINLPLLNNYLADTYLRSSAQFKKCGIVQESIDAHKFYIELAKQFLEYRDQLLVWKNYNEDLLNKSKLISDDTFKQVKKILSKRHNKNEKNESVRNLHKRTRKMALEYLPNIELAIKRHSGDLSSALASLALRDDVLVDAKWKYLYLFGEAIGTYDIFTTSQQINFYYDLLVKGQIKLNIESYQRV